MAGVKGQGIEPVPPVDQKDAGALPKAKDSGDRRNADVALDPAATAEALRKAAGAHDAPKGGPKDGLKAVPEVGVARPLETVTAKPVESVSARVQQELKALGQVDLAFANEVMTSWQDAIRKGKVPRPNVQANPNGPVEETELNAAQRLKVFKNLDKELRASVGWLADHFALTRDPKMSEADVKAILKEATVRADKLPIQRMKDQVALNQSEALSYWLQDADSVSALGKDGLTKTQQAELKIWASTSEELRKIVSESVKNPQFIKSLPEVSDRDLRIWAASTPEMVDIILKAKNMPDLSSKDSLEKGLTNLRRGILAELGGADIFALVSQVRPEKLTTAHAVKVIRMTELWAKEDRQLLANLEAAAASYPAGAVPPELNSEMDQLRFSSAKMEKIKQDFEKASATKLDSETLNGLFRRTLEMMTAERISDHVLSTLSSKELRQTGNLWFEDFNKRLDGFGTRAELRRSPVDGLPYTGYKNSKYEAQQIHLNFLLGHLPNQREFGASGTFDPKAALELATSMRADKSSPYSPDGPESKELDALITKLKDFQPDVLERNFNAEKNRYKSYGDAAAAVGLTLAAYLAARGIKGNSISSIVRGDLSALSAGEKALVLGAGFLGSGIGRTGFLRYQGETESIQDTLVHSGIVTATGLILLAGGRQMTKLWADKWQSPAGMQQLLEAKNLGQIGTIVDRMKLSQFTMQSRAAQKELESLAAANPRMTLQEAMEQSATLKAVFQSDDGLQIVGNLLMRPVYDEAVLHSVASLVGKPNVQALTVGDLRLASSPTRGLLSMGERLKALPEDKLVGPHSGGPVTTLTDDYVNLAKLSDEINAGGNTSLTIEHLIMLQTSRNPRATELLKSVEMRADQRLLSSLTNDRNFIEEVAALWGTQVDDLTVGQARSIVGNNQALALRFNELTQGSNQWALRLISEEAAAAKEIARSLGKEVDSLTAADIQQTLGQKALASELLERVAAFPDIRLLDDVIRTQSIAAGPQGAQLLGQISGAVPKEASFVSRFLNAIPYRSVDESLSAAQLGPRLNRRVQTDRFVVPTLALGGGLLGSACYDRRESQSCADVAKEYALPYTLLGLSFGAARFRSSIVYDAASYKSFANTRHAVNSIYSFATATPLRSFGTVGSGVFYFGVQNDMERGGANLKNYERAKAAIDKQLGLGKSPPAKK